MGRQLGTEDAVLCRGLLLPGLIHGTGLDDWIEPSSVAGTKPWNWFLHAGKGSTISEVLASWSGDRDAFSLVLYSSSSSTAGWFLPANIIPPVSLPAPSATLLPAGSLPRLNPKRVKLFLRFPVLGTVLLEVSSGGWMSLNILLRLYPLSFLSSLSSDWSRWSPELTEGFGPPWSFLSWCVTRNLSRKEHDKTIFHLKLVLTYFETRYLPTENTVCSPGLCLKRGVRLCLLPFLDRARAQRWQELTSVPEWTVWWCEGTQAMDSLCNLYINMKKDLLPQNEQAIHN